MSSSIPNATEVVYAHKREREIGIQSQANSWESKKRESNENERNEGEAWSTVNVTEQ